MNLWETGQQVFWGVEVQLQALSSSFLRKIGLGGHRRPRAVWRDLDWPKSALAESSVAYCRSLSPEYLVWHCFRTYAWAVLLAQRDGVQYENELLFVACILHDLGLTHSAAPTEAVPCFAISGAQAAERFLQSQQCPSDVAYRIADAIALHLNVKVPLTAGVEAHLLHEGAAFDVIGSRVHQVEPHARTQVLERYPRHNFVDELKARLGHPCICRPGTRMGLLCRGGFLSMISRSPLERRSSL